MKTNDLTLLSVNELRVINGGDIFKKFGNWLGSKWKEIRCGCDDYPSISSMYDDIPPA